ncbi:hypothetical protein JOD67_005780 [Tenggerimyces flavus]|nr:hypothetical protein [Tenggerimyces flavus]
MKVPFIQTLAVGRPLQRHSPHTPVTTGWSSSLGLPSSLGRAASHRSGWPSSMASLGGRARICVAQLFGVGAVRGLLRRSMVVAGPGRVKGVSLAALRAGERGVASRSRPLTRPGPATCFSRAAPAPGTGARARFLLARGLLPCSRLLWSPRSLVVSMKPGPSALVLNEGHLHSIGSNEGALHSNPEHARERPLCLRTGRALSSRAGATGRRPPGCPAGSG